LNITPEMMADLERKIAERAQLYVDRPEKRPRYIRVSVSPEELLSSKLPAAFGPYGLLEACLERAAEELAPDWDHMMLRYIDRPPEMKLGLYRGPEPKSERWIGA
jgi:hypothetical protein